MTTSIYAALELGGTKTLCLVGSSANAISAELAIPTTTPEKTLGAAQGLRNFIYVTVGTGLGAGALIDGRPVHGLSHPEMGHMTLPRVSGDEDFVSACPFHRDCAEGLASGAALSKRWGAKLNSLSTDHPAWDLQAAYLAEFCHTLTLVYSPQRIVLGGGVSSEPLLQRVREKLFMKLNGYAQRLDTPTALNRYLCLPALGDQAGPKGAFLLAQSAA